MLLRNQATRKKAAAFTARPAAVALCPHCFEAALMIKCLDAALVWPAWEQSERK